MSSPPETAPPTIAQDSVDPLGDTMTSFLLSRKRETPGIDFKLILDTRRGGNFVKAIKDFFAFTNSGGGYILLGFAELPSGRYDPVGLPNDYHIDQAELQERFNAFSPEPLYVGYREEEKEINGTTRKFAVIYFPPAPHLLVPTKDVAFVDERGNERIAAKKGKVYIRRGTQSITASGEEERQAQERLREAHYQVSLISGKPEVVDEELYSDLFEILQLPGQVYQAIVGAPWSRAHSPDLSAYVIRGQELYSFDNPASSNVAEYLVRNETKSWDRDTFRASEEGARTVTELVKWELVGHASSLGLAYDTKRGRLFYPLEDGHDSRIVQWRSLARTAKRKVASKRYSSTLHREVFFHLAVTPGLCTVAGMNCLRLRPGFLFTSDGINPIYGQEQGRQLTAIENSVSNFNLGYLRGVLFWAGQLSQDAAVMTVRPDFVVSSDPVRTVVPLGLRADSVGISKVTSDEALPPGVELEE